jgi:hypothetical protein
VLPTQVQDQQQQRLPDQHAANASQHGSPAEAGGEPVAVAHGEQAAQRERDHQQSGLQRAVAQALLPEDGQGEEQAGEAGEVAQGQQLPHGLALAPRPPAPMGSH